MPEGDKPNLRQDERSELDTRVHDLLTSNIGIDPEGLHGVGVWTVFNHLRMGWGIAVGPGTKSEIVIRRFRRQLNPEDIAQMRLHMQPTVEDDAVDFSPQEETGRPFVGVIEQQDPRRDIIVEGEPSARALRLGMALAALPDDKLALVKADTERPLIISPNNLSFRQEGRIQHP